MTTGDDGRPIGAHRAAWEMAHGPIPRGLVVCHRCDNPPCVRPDHLFLGTASDNMRDMHAKARARREALEQIVAIVNSPAGGWRDVVEHVHAVARIALLDPT